MTKTNIKVWKLLSSTPTPKYAHSSDAGFDLASSINIVLQPNSLTIVPTGLVFEIPPDYEVQIRSRSGLACRGIIVNNAPGTIDSGYRSEIKLIIRNQTDDQYPVSIGDRLAQGVVAYAPQVNFIEAEFVSDSDRGVNGFGSTGVK